MTRAATQFDPIEQLAASLAAFEIAVAEINAIVPRVEFARERIEVELAAVRDQRDRLYLYDEAEAAAELHVKEDHLASMRRTHNLPHVAFGPKVRYTRQHLEQIISFFEIRNAGKPALRKAA